MSLADSAPLSTGSSNQTPTLAPPFEPIAAVSSSSSTAQDEQQSSAVAGSGVDEKKQKKRRSLFGFGKKKGEGDLPATSTSMRTTSASQSTYGAGADATPTLSKSTLPPPPPKTDAQAGVGVAPKPPAKDVPVRKPTSPILTDSFSPMSASITSSGVGGSNTTGSNYGGYYVMPPSSPGRSIAALSSSPRMSSPAGSQIFERDVQESNSVLMPGSPAIPSHITTENFIPPVLDASSEAITDGHLDPDTVEIITHTHHQPAGLAVAGVAGSGGVNSSAASGTFAWVDDVASSFVTDKDDSASNYGSFDTTDIRRLSFISFADVVQAEQQQQQHQQATAGPGSLAGLTSLAALSSGVNRSPSPMRSPTTTDRFGTSPPASKSGSVKNLELSPQRNNGGGAGRPLGSPTRSPKIAAIGSNTGSSLLQVGNSAEISVETMSQALRRTGSGDLSGVRSMPQSPI
ncbi:hypothetical protein SEUCBS139899_003995 [Sporothrix eucalyptigena]|uniref:Uncharacterized protein n=1 Tax=Sporothrix eucalyptigena TaxID=1812306 RepID=A0ABP0AK61_9PEZI